MARRMSRYSSPLVPFANGSNVLRKHMESKAWEFFPDARGRKAFISLGYVVMRRRTAALLVM
jgi:hypothetical protein